MSVAAAEEARQLAESAVRSIGFGYDATNDLRLKYVKQSSQGRLVSFGEEDEVRDMSIPGVIGSIADVPKPITCSRAAGRERGVRICSDVLSFQQMSEQFNHDLSLNGKIPSGQFNGEFDFRQGWEKDAANTKTLAFDGVFLTLYTISMEARTHLHLADHVKQEIPSIWDPDALARFISKYGTHVIVGIKMGGKDVVYVKQQRSSPLHPQHVQRKLKDVADKLYVDSTQSGILQHKEKEITFECKRKGGSTTGNLTHNEWIQTVPLEPEVISATLVPISSLLGGINGSGFLNHAINLYMRYKPPIEELHQFLEFQLPKQWAPVFGDLADLPYQKRHRNASLRLGFIGPKLYINTNPIDVGNRPVTGMRLYLEGKASNCLAIHMQHLSSQPKNFQLMTRDVITPHQQYEDSSSSSRYYEKLRWNSQVCTAPVESDDDLCIVTGSHLEVGQSGTKKVLFLRLHFSKVVGVALVKTPVWDCPPTVPHQSWGIISSLGSSSSAVIKDEHPVRTDIGSAVYPGGPPVPTRKPKLDRYVDSTEMARGPGDTPGYWVVSGARLTLENGKLCLQLKYSLLMISSHPHTTSSSQLL